LVEEFVPLLGVGEGAGVELSEDLVAIAGDHGVEDVAKGAREESPDRAASAPGASEFAEDIDNGIGAGDELFFWLFGVGYNVERVEICDARSVTLKDASSKGTLQGGEAEEIMAIMTESEFDQAVAEPAHAVVEEDGGRGHSIPS
jgi:hypothetical protein